jgi:hypothetical protein
MQTAEKASAKHFHPSFSSFFVSSSLTFNGLHTGRPGVHIAVDTFGFLSCTPSPQLLWNPANGTKGITFGWGLELQREHSLNVV